MGVDVCPHCGSTAFISNSLFMECTGCGTRYVRNPDGSLQRTEAFGTGGGTAGYGAGQAYGQQQPQYQVNVNNYNYGTQTAGYAYAVSSKSKIVTLLLCLFLGCFGAHWFYLGRWGWGLAYLFTLGFLGWGVLVDIFRIAFNRLRDANGLIPT